MSIEFELLSYIQKNKTYKGVSVGFFGLPNLSGKSNRSITTKLSLLKNKNFVTEKDNLLSITQKGCEFLKHKKQKLKDFVFEDTSHKPKNLLVLYDIPEDKKKERDWFRKNLKKMNFVMVQRSVWVGPSPLSKDFLDYVQEINLGDKFKTFKLDKNYKL